MEKEVEYPPSVLQGITPLVGGTPLPKNLRIFGSDTETFRGDPDTVQCFDGKEMLFKRVSPRTIFPTWLNWLLPRCRYKGVNIVGFHGLRYDAQIIFYEKRKEIYRQGSSVEFRYRGADVKMLFGKCNTWTIKKDGIKILVVDTLAFTGTSLARSAKMFKLPVHKLEKPKDLGKKRISTPEEEEYAKRDTEVQYYLTEKIYNGFHRDYGIRPCISGPQFASKVFRTFFVKPDETIPFPRTTQMRKASELSYHGGKNGFYRDRPVKIENAYELDITSAYPYAMASLPQMVRGDYVETDRFRRDRVGIYCISGVDHGKYPLIYDHRFRAIRGAFKEIWTSGFEVAEALKSPHVSIKKCWGFIWVPDPKYKRNPFKNYAEHFFAKKNACSKDDPNYQFYKVCLLNSLYGKTIQTVPQQQATDGREVANIDPSKFEEWDLLPREDKDLFFSGGIDAVWDSALNDYRKVSTKHIAGGLYNPFIASLITGHARAYLHRLETKYRAFHSSTDSIKTTVKVREKRGLGGLKIETFGRSYVFRNKLYLSYGKGFQYCGHDPKKLPFQHPNGKPIRDTDGQHLCKVGLHGFKGRAWELHDARHRLLRDRKLKYKYEHMVGLREGMRQPKRRIANMEVYPETLTL